MNYEGNTYKIETILKIPESVIKKFEINIFDQFNDEISSEL